MIPFAVVRPFLPALGIAIAIGGALFSSAAEALDAPPAHWMTWQARAYYVEWDANLQAVRGCAIGATRADKYGPWQTSVAAFDTTLMTAPQWGAVQASLNKLDHAALLALRTHSVSEMTLATIPCFRKFKMPAGPWGVATNASASTRPAYALNASGVRIQSTVRAPVGATCDCRKRSSDVLTTYCQWDGGPPMTVALCREF